MLENILDKIESLPPLPQTIDEIEKFRKKKDKEVDELTKIIEKDALVITTLLKTANSSLFGFRSKVESVGRVINLLGINFTIYVTISETINNLLSTDLTPYNIKSEDFIKASTASSNLVNLWVGKIDNEIKDDILLASILQETGKFVLSELIISRGLLEEFTQKLQSDIDVVTIERELLQMTTSQVTAEIFKYWKLSDELVHMIEFVDDVKNCKAEYKQKAQYLDVIKTACNTNSLLSTKSIEKALKKAESYNFEIEPLKKAIQILQDRIPD
ncbi:MAG: HDOD domain-containing protein [Aliarcobacter sp.]|nr:HDOD domain-containing protein [Aliarcobacter sp.]